MPTLAELLGQPTPIKETAKALVETIPNNPITPIPNTTLAIPEVQVNTTPGTTDTLPTSSLELLHSNLATLQSSLTNPQLVSTAVTTVLNTIANNPDLKDQLRPEDGALLVRGLQASYSVVHRSKTKRATTRKKSADAANVVAGALADIQL